MRRPRHWRSWPAHPRHHALARAQAVDVTAVPALGAVITALLDAGVRDAPLRPVGVVLLAQRRRGRRRIGDPIATCGAAVVTIAGALRFARFAVPPNARGY